MKLHLVIQSFPRNCETDVLGIGLTEELSLQSFQKGCLSKYLRNSDTVDRVKHITEEMNSIFKELVDTGGYQHPNNEYFINLNSIEIE